MEKKKNWLRKGYNQEKFESDPFSMYLDEKEL